MFNRYDNVYKQLDKIAAITDKEERRTALRSLLTNQPIATVIQYAYHPNAEFDLPEGPIPDKIWTPNKSPNHRGLLREARRLSYLLKSSTIDKRKKERIFIQILEHLEEEDARLIIAVVGKNLPWKTLNKAFVTNAVPELFTVAETAEPVAQEA